MLTLPMGIRRCLACLVPLLALLGAPCSAAAGAGVLRVGTSGDYAPFSTQLPAAPPGYEGFDVTLARAYAQERGLALEFVEFRWPQLAQDLRAGRFDVAMSGVTVAPRRSVVGRFSVPIAESGAVVLLRNPGRFSKLEEVDQRVVRIAVNAGGHLEQVARAHFSRATLVFIPENTAVRDALLGYSVDAAVTDTLEAPLWQSLDPELGLLGPFTRDRKAYLVRADRPGLAADLDAWLLARERDGSLVRLRRRHLGEKAAAPTATPLGALFAALDERLSLMPWVAAAKRRDVLPIADPAREAEVIEAALTSLHSAAKRSRAAPPPDEAVRAFFRAQIDAARQLQLAAGRDAPYPPEEPVPDLETELRPALLRIGERIATLLLALPEGLDAAEVQRAAREGLRSPWLQEDARRKLGDAVTKLSQQPRLAAEEETSSRPAPTCLSGWAGGGWSGVLRLRSVERRARPVPRTGLDLGSLAAVPEQEIELLRRLPGTRAGQLRHAALHRVHGAGANLHLFRGPGCQPLAGVDSPGQLWRVDQHLRAAQHMRHQVVCEAGQAIEVPEATPVVAAEGDGEIGRGQLCPLVEGHLEALVEADVAVELHLRQQPHEPCSGSLRRLQRPFEAPAVALEKPGTQVAQRPRKQRHQPHHLGRGAVLAEDLRTVVGREAA